MITGFHHFAIIASSEESIVFYRKLGFLEISRINRSYDTVVVLEGYGLEIEVFIDPRHPARPCNPECLGIRHLALHVDDVEKIAQEFDCGPIQKDWFDEKYCFTQDPDGLTIEFHE